MGLINFKTVTDPRAHEKLHRDEHTDLTALAAVVNEMRTDHGATKTTVDALRTLVLELKDDHATSKTAMDAIETLVEELKDEADLANAWAIESDANQDILANIASFHGADGVIDGDYTFAAQANIALLGAGSVRYRLNGVEHEASVAGNITLAIPATSPNINNTMYGAWRVLIDAAGTITTQAASADMQLEYGAVDGTRALLSLSAIPQTADTVCIGYVTILSAAAPWIVGTTLTNATCTFTPYYASSSAKKGTGLNAALGAATVATAGAATLAVGTIDVNVDGDALAQIAANGADVIDNADTIGAGTAGGWLLCTDLAGTGTVAVASNGVHTVTVSAMTDADVAAANTAIDTVCDNLPFMFCPISRITVVNASGGAFTGAATFWDAANMTTVVTDATVGTWDRTSTTGFDSHKINPPSIPATIAAPVPGAIAAADPASGPATLTAADPAAGPATITAPAVTLESEVG